MLTVAIAFAVVLPQQRVHSLTGNIKHHDGFESKVLGNKRNLIVYLPPDYETNPSRRYPVLYMHDGQNVFDGMTSYIPNQEWRADEAAEKLIKAGKIDPMIIVGIDNGQMERANEYLPTKAKMNGSRDAIGGKADLYEKMVSTEIMPLINSTYRTKTGAANTGLLGSSFGGVITLYMGLTHPERYSKLGVVSPSIWWDDRVLIKQVKALPAKPNVKIWMDIGSKEGYQAEKDVRDMKYALENRGFVLGQDLAVMVDPGAMHNEKAWAGRMERILLFLYSR